MHSLRETQRALGKALLRGEYGAAAGLVAADGIEPEERLAIYRNNVRIGFRTTLEAEFPIVRQLGGDDWFAQIALTYHRAQPSRAGNLHFVGQQFAAFLATELGGTPFEYFADVARLEWAYQEILVAPDHAPLDFARLRQVAPERYGELRFRLAPAARLIASDFPVLALWQAHRDPELYAVAQTQEALQHIDLLNDPQNVLLLRRETHAELRALAGGEFAFLNACAHQDQAGESLEAALTLAQACNSKFDPMTGLMRFVQLGAIVDFTLPPTL